MFYCNDIFSGILVTKVPHVLNVAVSMESLQLLHYSATHRMPAGCFSAVVPLCERKKYDVVLVASAEGNVCTHRC